MAKKHIIEIGYQKFACDSITAATQAIAILSKLTKVTLNLEADDSDKWFYEPDTDRRSTVELKLNQNYRERKPEKPLKEPKPLALPKPARGTILCICEKSYVAPRQSCPHCGRAFSESHNRTHQSTATPSHPTLRLVE